MHVQVALGFTNLVCVCYKELAQLGKVFYGNLKAFAIILDAMSDTPRHYPIAFDIVVDGPEGIEVLSSEPTDRAQEVALPGVLCCCEERTGVLSFLRCGLRARVGCACVVCGVRV